MFKQISLATLCGVLIACQAPLAHPSGSSSSTEYERLLQKSAEQQARSEAQQKRVEEQMLITEKHQQRMEALLTRWESQADRYDAILSKWEKQNPNTK